MLKNEKGISLITIVITVIVMVIILSITISSSIKSIDETNNTKIENEIANLKSAVSDRMVQHERNDMLYPLIGEKIGDNIYEYIRLIENIETAELTKIIDNISKSYSNDTSDYYRLVGVSEAEILKIEGFNSNHCYVVDYNEGEVYGPISVSLLNP